MSTKIDMSLPFGGANKHETATDAQRPVECLVGRLREFETSDALGDGDFTVCLEAAQVIKRQASEIELMREFVEEVRRSGDTRLASMAIAILSVQPNAELTRAPTGAEQNSDASGRRVE